MGWSALAWSKLLLAGAMGAGGTLLGAAALAQQDPPGDTDLPAMKQELDEILDERSETNDESAAVQKEIDELSDETDDLSAKYRTALTQIDSIRIYNQQLRELIGSQTDELASLQDQLDRVEVVGRSVTPLMLRMIEALEATVELDLPFLLEERSKRIADLRELMTRAAVSNAEKYRLIMEAYQTENEYGRTIEAYRSNLQRGDREIKVDFLRFGRIALVYQTLDGKETGFWNQEEKRWELLDSSYQTPIREGLRIARKQAAPDLIRLPLPVPGRGPS
jgi:septal ring factor EnvC (AmiA/AmiB activator)